VRVVHHREHALGDAEVFECTARRPRNDSLEIGVGNACDERQPDALAIKAAGA